MIRPQIHFSSLDTRDWVGKSLMYLGEEMERLRERVKEASDYPYDNSHFYIDDGYGHPALQVLFSTNPDYPAISFWNATNGVAMDTLEGVTWTEKMSKIVEDWIRHIEKGYTKCQECGRWVKHINHFGFAGGVCDKCYDPTTHLPPDTTGD